jgi:hypothetical protein
MTKERGDGQEEGQDQGDVVADYVRELACELAVMAKAAGQDTLSLILEMAVLEAADLRDRGGPDPGSKGND